MADQSRPVTGNQKTKVYPYESPSPNAQQNQPPDPYSSRQGTIFGILICILGIGVWSLIIWPIWLFCISYPHFRIQTLTVANLTIDSLQISGVWDAQLTVRNPNWGISIHCDKIKVAVLYDWCTISTTTVPPPPFKLGSKNKTAIRAEFPPTESFYFEPDGEYPKKGSDGAIKFNVWMQVRVKPSAWGASRTKLKVYCPDLPVLASSKVSVGTMVGGSKKCWVNSDWITETKPPEVRHCSFQQF